MKKMKKGDSVIILSKNSFWNNKKGIIKSNIDDNIDVDSLIKVSVMLDNGKNVIETFLLNELSLAENSTISETILNENIDNTEIKDNLGNILSAEQINYFRDSKVRDKHGNLLVCYHGSSAQFDTFEISKIRRGNSLGKGFYFSSNAETSAQYTKTGDIKQVYLNIKNPKYFTVTGAAQEFLLQQAIEYNIPNYDEDGKIINLNNKVSEVLQQHGYDGVIAYIPHADMYEIVAYNSNQIKAIDNKTPTSSANIYELYKEISSDKPYTSTQAFIESFINKDCKFLGYEYDELYAKHENDKGDYVFDDDDLEYINYYKYLETLKCKIINCAMLDYSSKKSIMENFKDSFWDLIFENGDTLTAISGESIQLLDKSIFENYLTESIITPRTADLIESYFGEDIDWLFVSKIATAEDIPESEIIENALQNKYKVIAITTEYKSTYIILAKHTDEKSLLRDYASYLPGFKKIERIK